MSNLTSAEIRAKCAHPNDDILVYIYRYLFSWPLIGTLVKTNITPNQVTFTSFGFAILSSFFFAQGNFTYTIIAIGFLHFSWILDLVDGDLARCKNLTSKLGAWLDPALDPIGYGLVNMGVVIGQYRLYGHVDDLIWGFIGTMFMAFAQFLIAGRVFLKTQYKAFNYHQFNLSKKFYFGYSSTLIFAVTFATLFSFVDILFRCFALAATLFISVTIFRIYKTFSTEIDVPQR